MASEEETDMQRLTGGASLDTTPNVSLLGSGGTNARTRTFTDADGMFENEAAASDPGLNRHSIQNRMTGEYLTHLVVAVSIECALINSARRRDSRPCRAFFVSSACTVPWVKQYGGLAKPGTNV